MPFDDTLLDWAKIENDFVGGALLIGNGASCAVWANFRYQSLYDIAKTRVAHPISLAAQQLFTHLDTQNFEEILLVLDRSKLTCNTLGQGQSWHTAGLPAALDAHYENIRAALVEAVKSVHISWNSLPSALLERLGREFLRYDSVFSTNYDLLLYWSIMQCEPTYEQERDFFWAEEFDLSKAETWPTRSETKTYFLHGGLHLYRTAQGKTLKRQFTGAASLLNQFGTPYNNGAVPLFVSEATWRQKFSAIKRSDYLTFAFVQFARNTSPLTVFGSSFGDNDNHIAKALCGLSANRTRKIAISLRPSTTQNAIAARKAAITERLSRFGLQTMPHFFDSTTHPLGAPSVNIPVPTP